MTAALAPHIQKFVAKNISTENFECHQLAGDASTRKYYRIVFDDQSRVLMSWEPFEDPATYPFLNVQAHFARFDIRVPKVEAIAPELGVVLLEDLGDLTLERKFWENQNQAAAMPFYEQAVDEIVKIHFLTTQSGKPPTSVCQLTKFDTAKFMWEMNYAKEHFFEKVGQVKLSPADETTLQAEFLNICEALDQQPKFVCHRDYHSRNLMLKLGRVYVIDFQDARLGPIQYDLVSLVYDSYVRLNPESIEHIKTNYIQKAKAHGPTDAIRPDFESIFHVQTVQRCFKACGSFTSFYNMRNDTRYLKYIKQTAQLVAHTMQNSDAPAIRKAKLMTSIITDSGLLDRNYEELCEP
jgi:aminoglycoside/choline kinase family phosphotransferase